MYENISKYTSHCDASNIFILWRKTKWELNVSPVFRCFQELRAEQSQLEIVLRESSTISSFWISDLENGFLSCREIYVNLWALIVWEGIYFWELHSFAPAGFFLIKFILKTNQNWIAAVICRPVMAQCSVWLWRHGHSSCAGPDAYAVPRVFVHVYLYHFYVH